MRTRHIVNTLLLCGILLVAAGQAASPPNEAPPAAIKTALPEVKATPPEVGAIPPEVQTIPPAVGTALPEVKAALPDAKTALPDAKTLERRDPFSPIVEKTPLPPLPTPINPTITPGEQVAPTPTPTPIPTPPPTPFSDIKLCGLLTSESKQLVIFEINKEIFMATPGEKISLSPTPAGIAYTITFVEVSNGRITIKDEQDKEHYIRIRL